jgi:hypothetical protein
MHLSVCMYRCACMRMQARMERNSCDTMAGLIMGGMLMSYVVCVC